MFLISFNRGHTLKKAIAGIRRLARATEIIVHDNGSNSSETLAVLDALEQSGVRVFRHSAIVSSSELTQVDETVQSYFSDWNEPARYVVSDCDIDMSVADPRALDIYDELLNKFRHIDCVGPMLRIRDIPPTYPLFNQVMNRHIKQFWSHMPTFQQTSCGQVAVLETKIDTTFALHRAGEPFRRLKSALRVYEPFEALHLDWYPTEYSDSTYSKSSSPGISHWDNADARARYKNVALKYSDFNAVRRNSSGALEVFKQRI